MKKSMVKVAAAVSCMLVLAAVVMLGVSKFPNSIHSSVLYGNSGEYTSLERITAARPPLAEPNTHVGSADLTEISIVSNLQPIG